MAKFMRRGKAKVYFLPTVAGTIPTAPEVTAGTDLSARVADMNGWVLESTQIDVPDLASRYVSKIPGEQNVGDSSLTIYADDANTDAIKTALATDTNGYIYIAHSGAGTGKKADLFPVRVSSVGNEYSMGNDAARYIVNFSITAPPSIDVAQA
jgi:hypothetical protein